MAGFEVSTEAVLLRLNLALTHSRAPAQPEILRMWAGPEMADRILAVMREERVDFVFHEGQVLNLIRLVILHSPSDEGLRCERPEEFWLLTRALLMITDLMFPDRRVTDLRATIFPNFTRSELFMHDEQYVPNTMARNHDLFVMLPRIMPFRGQPLDMAGTFRALTGLEIEDYLGLGFGLLAHYDAIDPQGLGLGNAAIGIQRATYLRDVRLPPERRGSGESSPDLSLLTERRSKPNGTPGPSRRDGLLCGPSPSPP